MVFLVKGTPTPGLGPCNLSVLSFIHVQGSVFIFILETVLPVREGKASPLFSYNQRKVWAIKHIFQQDRFVSGKSLSPSALVKTANFELITFEVMM